MKIINNILKISSIPKSCRERFLDLQTESATALRSAGIYYSGISDLCDGYCIGDPHPPPNHMLIFTVSGKGFLWTENAEYYLTPGTCISVPPGNSCMWKTQGSEWRIFWFYMRNIQQWDLLSQKKIWLFDVPFIRKIEQAMENFLEESISTSSISQKASRLYAEILVLQLKRALGISFVCSDEALKSLENLRAKIYSDMARSWTVKDMAENMNVSPATLQRMTIKYYKTTPWKMVVDMRMQQARLLLMNTAYPLKVIAERLGYADAFVFSNAFKHNSGLSPKKFRLKNSNLFPSKRNDI